MPESRHRKSTLRKPGLGGTFAAIWAALALLVPAIMAPAPAVAQTTFIGSLPGWCVTAWPPSAQLVACGATVDEGCQAAMQLYNNFPPHYIYLGAVPGNGWFAQGCNVSGFPTFNLGVHYTCANGGAIDSASETCPEWNPFPQSCPPSPCLNGSGTPFTPTGKPIDILSGDKSLTVKDFVSADNSLELTRDFSSLRYAGGV